MKIGNPFCPQCGEPIDLAAAKAGRYFCNAEHMRDWHREQGNDANRKLGLYRAYFRRSDDPSTKRLTAAVFIEATLGLRSFFRQRGLNGYSEGNQFAEALIYEYVTKMMA